MHSGKSAYQSNLLANGCVQNDPSNIETVIDVYISTTNKPAPVTSEACDESYLACAFFSYLVRNIAQNDKFIE